MYRVIAIVGAALVLAACSSDSDVFKSGYFRMEPVLNSVRFESEPPGAVAKTSTGQSCTTPCALALPGDKPFDVTFTLNGYQPDLEKVTAFDVGDGTTKLRPNPVLAELTPLPPPPKKKRRRRVIHHRHKAAAKKPAPKPMAPKPVAPPPMTSQQPQAPSPWPAPTQQ